MDRKRTLKEQELIDEIKRHKDVRAELISCLRNADDTTTDADIVAWAAHLQLKRTHIEQCEEHLWIIETVLAQAGNGLFASNEWDDYVRAYKEESAKEGGRPYKLDAPKDVDPPKFIIFNTGCSYDDYGQIILACECDGTIYFEDLSRHIPGSFPSDGRGVEVQVMDGYQRAKRKYYPDNTPNGLSLFFRDRGRKYRESINLEK